MAKKYKNKWQSVALLYGNKKPSVEIDNPMGKGIYEFRTWSEAEKYFNKRVNELKWLMKRAKKGYVK